MHLYEDIKNLNVLVPNILLVLLVRLPLVPMQHRSMVDNKESLHMQINLCEEGITNPNLGSPLLDEREEYRLHRRDLPILQLLILLSVLLQPFLMSKYIRKLLHLQIL
jgi:hypothetical protein